MEDPPIAIHHSTHNSKKRCYRGSSSSSGDGGGSGGSSAFADADVIEIPPPATWKSRTLKQKSIDGHEIIVLDDEDSDDILIVDEKVGHKSKGKKPMLSHLGGNNGSANNEALFSQANGSVKGFQSITEDDISEMVLFDEECAMLQAYFDSVDIQSGVEATVPWWPVSQETEKQAAVSTNNSFGLGKLASSSSTVSDGMQTTEPESIHSKKSVSRSTHHKLKLPLPADQVNPGIYMPTFSAMSPWWSAPSYIDKNQPAPTYSHKNQATLANPYKLPPYGPSYGPGWPTLPGYKSTPFNASAFDIPNPDMLSYDPIMAGITDHTVRLDDGITAGITPVTTEGQGDTNENSVLKKLELFKKFDCVEDPAGHFYVSKKESYTQSSSWKKKIHAEWKMLERDLPDSIYVRVYEGRMDLLRAVILGADGTPYHDGLFFFDVHFTASYPTVPPHVNYHAHGLRINPNLYNCGKVCLSLLGTWSGSAVESWQSGKSNMLQVLVSIQALILNTEPYYNEPGYESSKNTSHGRSKSEAYSENTFLLSLKTMLYTMRSPPKYFEDLVHGHFHQHAHDILSACRAYLDGVQVGSFVKGKPHSSPERGRSCSRLLQTNLPSYIKSLVEAFSKIGVKDCEKYLVSMPTNPKPPTESSKRSFYKSKY